MPIFGDGRIFPYPLGAVPGYLMIQSRDRTDDHLANKPYPGRPITTDIPRGFRPTAIHYPGQAPDPANRHGSCFFLRARP